MISQATHPRSRLFAPPALPAPTPPSASAPLIAVDANPLQHPGCDVRLRRCTYGGPICAVDVRMYFDRRLLQAMLTHAEATVTGRVQVDRAGLLVELHRGQDGRHYEVWTLLSGSLARPEPGPFSEDAGPGSQTWQGDEPRDPLGRVVALSTGALRRTLYGDPVSGDVRVFLDSHILRMLLTRSEQALSGRVQLDSVGIVVDHYANAQGKLYEVWCINTNGEPRPEPDRIEERANV